MAINTTELGAGALRAQLGRYAALLGTDQGPTVNHVKRHNPSQTGHRLEQRIPLSGGIHHPAHHHLASDGTIMATPDTGPVCDDTLSESVATPTEKRGFVLSRFIGKSRSARGYAQRFWAGMRLSARTAARLRTRHQHPRPPHAFDDAAGGFQTPEGGRATQPNDTTTTNQVAAHNFTSLPHFGPLTPIDAHVDPADFTDSDRAEFERMALRQEAFNALARAQRDLLASRNNYPNAIAQAHAAIAAMTTLALVNGGAA